MLTNRFSLADYPDEPLDKALHKDLLKRGLLDGPERHRNKATLANVLIKKAARSDHWKSFLFMLNPIREPLARVSLALDQSNLNQALNQTKKCYLKRSFNGACAFTLHMDNVRNVKSVTS